MRIAEGNGPKEKEQSPRFYLRSLSIASLRLLLVWSFLSPYWSSDALSSFLFLSLVARELRLLRARSRAVSDSRRFLLNGWPASCTPLTTTHFLPCSLSPPLPLSFFSVSRRSSPPVSPRRSSVSCSTRSCLGARRFLSVSFCLFCFLFSPQHRHFLACAVGISLSPSLSFSSPCVRLSASHTLSSDLSSSFFISFFLPRSVTLFLSISFCRTLHIAWSRIFRLSSASASLSATFFFFPRQPPGRGSWLAVCTLTMRMGGHVSTAAATPPATLEGRHFQELWLRFLNVTRRTLTHSLTLALSAHPCSLRSLLLSPLLSFPPELGGRCHSTRCHAGRLLSTSLGWRAAHTKNCTARHGFCEASALYQ